MANAVFLAATLMRMGTTVYFLFDTRYGRYDRAEDRLDDGYPLPIAGNWPGITHSA
jgi:hypothetical protein